MKNESVANNGSGTDLTMSLTVIQRPLKTMLCLLLMWLKNPAISLFLKVQNLHSLKPAEGNTLDKNNSIHLSPLTSLNPHPNGDAVSHVLAHKTSKHDDIQLSPRRIILKLRRRSRGGRKCGHIY